MKTYRSEIRCGGVCCFKTSCFLILWY